MRTGFARLVSVIAVLGAGLGLAACSGSGASSGNKPASVVLPEVQSAVKSAKSVHMTGRVVSGSQTVTFDLSFVGTSAVYGTMAVSGASFGLLTLSGQTYIKINASFLTLAKAPASVCSVVCGKYVQVPAVDAESITGTLSMGGLMNGIFGKIPASAKSSKVNFVPATYHGQSVLQLKRSGYSIEVASSGTAYPLAITAPNDEYLDFSDWNSVSLPTLPPSSEIVNLSQLG